MFLGGVRGTAGSQRLRESEGEKGRTGFLHLETIHQNKGLVSRTQSTMANADGFTKTSDYIPENDVVS